jgi:hypothetical protein
MTIPIVSTAMPIAFQSPASLALAMKEPTPGSVIVVSPTVIASEATTKNQPPDIDIIVFQIRPGIAYGASSCQNFCHPVNRKPRATSSKSLGTVRSD